MNQVNTRDHDVNNKIKEYAAFIDNTLHPELERRVLAREKIEEEIEEYRDLAAKLQAVEERTSTSQPLQALVDLGHKTIFCQAETSVPLKLYVHVGMGFHVEMTTAEAISFCHARIDYLSRVLNFRMERAAQVARDLQASLVIMEQLYSDVTRNGP
jgi:prefoldin subunit 5